MTLGKQTQGEETRRLWPESADWDRLPDGHFQGVKWILQGKVWVNLINFSEKRIYPSLPRIRQHHKLYPWRGTNDYQRVENQQIKLSCLYSTLYAHFYFILIASWSMKSKTLNLQGRAEKWNDFIAPPSWLSDWALGSSSVAYFWPGFPSAQSARQGTNSGSFLCSAFTKWGNATQDPKAIFNWHSNFILEQHLHLPKCVQHEKTLRWVYLQTG